MRSTVISTLDKTKEVAKGRGHSSVGRADKSMQSCCSRPEGKSSQETVGVIIK
jgi:hypothetical protein